MDKNQNNLYQQMDNLQKTQSVLSEQVGRLDERQRSLTDAVKEIKDNHLAHIQSDMDKLKKNIEKIDLKIAYYTGGLGVILVALQFFFYLYK